MLYKAELLRLLSTGLRVLALWRYSTIYYNIL